METDDLLVSTISTCVITLGAILSKTSDFEKAEELVKDFTNINVRNIKLAVQDA